MSTRKKDHEEKGERRERSTKSKDHVEKGQRRERTTGTKGKKHEVTEIRRETRRDRNTKRLE